MPLQLRDFQNVPKNVNIDKLKDVTLDLAVLTDDNYRATGWVRYDDGLTQDLTKYSQFTFNAKGLSPFIGTSYIDITITIDKDDSTDKTSKNQKLGSVVIYYATQYAFKAASR